MDSPNDFVVQSATKTAAGYTARAVTTVRNVTEDGFHVSFDPIEIEFPVPADVPIGARYRIVAADPS